MTVLLSAVPSAGSYRVRKMALFQQTDPSAPLPDLIGPYFFLVRAFNGTLPVTDASLTFSGDFNLNPQSLTS